MSGVHARQSMLFSATPQCKLAVTCHGAAIVANQKQLEGLVTDFFVHDNCFLREPVGVPNPVGDDRKE